ncbi:cytochrome P450 [Archangium sp.]|jgi:hypothetical protein|uniref:cytochrome P450 n=1 Tax=Archangium sp. TaxID=1872627 RepID=UPI002EDB277E
MSPRLNLMTPEVRSNPYPFYAELREHAPVCQVDPLGLWAVTRYEDALTVLKDPRRFSSSNRERVLPPWLKNNELGQMLITQDPPEHTAMRNLVNRAFGGPALTRLQPRIRELAETLADKVARQREVEFIADFALPLPASVIGELLGMDPALHSRFKEWADDLLSINAGGHSPERIVRVQRSFDDLTRYLREVIEDRRRTPRDDIMGELVRAEVDGRVLTDRELLGFGALLLVAGLETTVHLLSNTLLTLSRHPEVLARVRADLGLVPRLLEEVLRYEPPVHGVMRRTTEEVELSGVKVPKDAMLFVLLASAGRDPRQFSEADRFSLEREKHGNLPFGHGIHFCLGAALARLEARLGLEALFTRVEDFTRLTEGVEWGHALTVRGPVKLPLRFTPA